MFGYEKTVDDKDGNDHDDYQSEDGESGCARAGVKILETIVEDRVVRQVSTALKEFFDVTMTVTCNVKALAHFHFACC